MNGDSNLLKKIYSVLFVVLMMVLFVYMPIRIHLKGGFGNDSYLSFSDGWRMDSGEILNLEDVLSEDYGGEVTVEKELPPDVKNTDSLCFESQNTNIRVFINDKLVYEFVSRPNLTGEGYGIAFHEVGINEKDAGKTVRLQYERVYARHNRGRIMNIYICSASAYIIRGVREVMIPAILCALTVMFGIVLMIIHGVATNKDVLPFDALALGAGAVLMGVWLFLDTNIMQLVTGDIYLWRALSRVLPFTIGYPILVFFNSLTKIRREIFIHIGFWTAFAFTFGIIFLRYTFGYDMLDSFSMSLAVYMVLLSGLVIFMAVDNSRYCRRSHITTDYRLFYLGAVSFFVCGGIDIVIYFVSRKKAATNGSVAMLGMTVFVLIMLISFLRWWMKDHEAIERDRFINRALSFAISSNSPDESIRAIIDFIGRELEAKRFFILEDQKNGKYRGTYEWYTEGLQSASIEMMYLPYKGFIDKLSEEFDKRDHRLIVDKPDAYKDSIPGLYNTMKTNHIENMVVAPLEVSGHIFGICGVMDIPKKSQDAIAEIINLISYFLSQLIRQREEQDRMFLYNYKDALSGAGNYTSYRKFVEEELDIGSAFGLVRCDLRGIDEINITQGFDVGDQMLVMASRNLMEVFGEQNVYRMNGTQFMAFGFETDEIYFNNDVERVRKQMAQNSIDATIASVYCIYGTKDFSIVKKRVDDLMKENQ